MRKLAGRLSYANVMASIAVFIALGAGAYAAVNLPRNSVKSKHIKNAQVKNKDLRNEAVTTAKLRGEIRPLHFDGELPSPSLNDIILEEEGYRVAMACGDAGGVPELDGTLRVPQDGTLAIQRVTSETNGLDDPLAASPQPISGGVSFPIDVSAPDPSEKKTTGAVATYSGSTRAALITIHATADDDTGTCTLNGSLIPLTPVE